MGGSSTVVSPTLPPRNDTRSKVGYGYRDGEYCVGYPFLDDEDRVRMDYVCFSHDDARLIAAAPDLLDALESIYLYANDTLSGRTDGPDDREWQRAAVIEVRNRARAALAKAEGRS